MMMDRRNPCLRTAGPVHARESRLPPHEIAPVVAMAYRHGKPFSSSAAEIGSIMRALLAIANVLGVTWQGGRHTISIAVAGIPQFSSIRFQ